jgi:hypothetical protein
LSAVAEHTSADVVADHAERISPGEAVQKVSNIFRSTRAEIDEHLGSASMRRLVNKQLDRAEATACRAVLQAK